MSNRTPTKLWYIVTMALVVVLGIGACSPFAKTAEVQQVPTVTPQPTETALPVLPTYTPTRVVQPTETPTQSPTTEAEEGSTPEPTPEAPSKIDEEKETTEESTAAVVAYKVTRIPTLGDVVQNGSFEQGFVEDGVGTGWTSFDNGGAVYAWVDETDPWHVSHDDHAQLIQVMGPGEPDRFVGIYQTVDVIAGETYTLTLHGLIRSSTAEKAESMYGHRIQWSIDYEGQTNWYALNQEWDEWTDTGWNDIKLDAAQPVMNAFVDTITAQSDKLTLYIRGWTKWPLINSEAKYYIDGVTLQGPVPGEETIIRVASSEDVEGGQGMPTTGGSGIWIPIIGIVAVLGFASWEIRKAWKR